MSIFIEAVRSATPAEWDYIWQQCNYSTYFHSREWAEIWEEYANYQQIADPRLIIFGDNKKALLPFSYIKTCKGLSKNYVSSPAGTFGGWISADPLEQDHLKILWRYIKRLNIIMRQNPYDELLGKLDFSWTKRDFTQALDLRLGFDSIYRKWTKGHASAVRKANKHSVIIRDSTSLEEWKEYYRAYEASLLRWGDKASSKYAWTLFDIMYKKKSPHIKLWLATWRDIITSGAICFYTNKHAVYWHGAAYEEYFELRPINLLQYVIIKDACEKGYWYYDFNPSGGHEGVFKFKKSFGCKQLHSNLFIKKPFINKYLDKYRIARSRVYRRLF